MNYTVYSWNAACPDNKGPSRMCVTVFLQRHSAWKSISDVWTWVCDAQHLLHNTSKWTDTRCDGCPKSDWYVLLKMQLAASVQSLSQTPALSPPMCDVGTSISHRRWRRQQLPETIGLNSELVWVVTLRFCHVSVEAWSCKSTYWFRNCTIGKCPA